MFRLAAAALGLSALAVCSELILRMLPVADATLGLPVNEANPVPRLLPNRQFRFSKGWDFSVQAVKRTNNYGFLSDQDYAAQGPRPLIVVIGDSYVEAMQVSNAEALTALLANATGDLGRVYGIGLSGTGLSTYLAYAAWARREFAPDALVFTVISNDFDESLLKYHRQARNHYFIPGPDGNLILWRYDYSASVLKRIARRSALVRYLALNCQLTPANLISLFSRDDAYVANTRTSVDSQRLADSRQVVDAFFRLLPGVALLPTERIAFLMDGLRPSLYSGGGMAAARGSYPYLMRDYFMKKAEDLGYETIDLQPIFEYRHRRLGERFEFPTDNHWNALGHRVAAGAVCRSRLFAGLFDSASLACPLQDFPR
jgi:hypothetical protein